VRIYRNLQGKENLKMLRIRRSKYLWKSPKFYAPPSGTWIAARR